ncbi:hypothetical protein PTSG_12188 [Salpingoeca rosetta]|uniref:PDIA6-like C-terminal thioredoxin-like domain-containing protein n=1 Tax=Salpingoeca rosetta (strain ATCC 50818 / BSB-021) TaxID=946362 RepID=F2U8T6_SALR5|nr:uncharacterized protein PTSG_12188 [Salpingoeca rosetta]EGD72794.1 hypothetical protein PTSG_12188 [Salpingoeca rosetta]|eukprot:XP_004994617.1 hypothetical protein PTSG_12188 [Salpingoeca rosetta]
MMKLLSVLLVLVGTLALVHGFSVPLESITKASPLSKEEMNTLMTVRMPFVLAFHDGEDNLDEDIISEYAQQLDGLGRFATVDVSNPKYADFLKTLDVSTADHPSFRVYGFSAPKTDFLDTENFEEVVPYVRDSLPDDLITTVPDPSVFQQMLVEDLQQKKLPVFILTNKDGVPDMVTKLGIWLGRTFGFHMFIKPDPNTMQSLGLTKLPTIVVMAPTKAEGDSLAFAPQPYDRTRFGGLKFLNVVHYLLSIQNALARDGVLEEVFAAFGADKQAEEPFTSSSSSSNDVEREDVFEVTAETPDFCSENQLGLCIIAFLDGSPANQDKDTQIDVLKQVQSDPANKGRILRFMWVDQVCRPDLGQAFGVDIDKVPTVIAVSPKRQKFALQLGAFSPKSISEFITGVLTGRVSIQPFSQMPSVGADDDCTAAHAAFALPVEEEDDIDLDDIMAEILEEEERKGAEEDDAAADMAAQADAIRAREEEAELEHKRKLAQLEIERLNRASNCSCCVCV